MAGTKVNSRKLRKSVKSRRVKQRGGLPNFLSMFEGRKAGADDGVVGAEEHKEVPHVTTPVVTSEPVSSSEPLVTPEGEKVVGVPGVGGVRKLLGFGGRRSRRASRRVRRRKVRRTARRVRRRSSRRSNRRK